MKMIFEELEVAHYNYHEFLEMYDDGSSDDVDKCNDWFQDVMGHLMMSTSVMTGFKM